MNTKSAGYRLWIIVPVLSALNQACIKLLSERMAGTPFGWHWFFTALFTPYAVAVILLEAFGFILWLRILAHTGLSKAMPITATAYILILLLGWVAFGEPVLPLQIIGSALILTGVWMIGTATNTPKEAP